MRASLWMHGTKLYIYEVNKHFVKVTCKETNQVIYNEPVTKLILQDPGREIDRLKLELENFSNEFKC